MQNIGRNLSEKARKEIEKSFELVVADERKQGFQLKPVDVRKVQYGRMETKRVITNVLERSTISISLYQLAET